MKYLRLGSVEPDPCSLRDLINLAFCTFWDGLVDLNNLIKLLRAFHTVLYGSRYLQEWRGSCFSWTSKGCPGARRISSTPGLVVVADPNLGPGQPRSARGFPRSLSSLGLKHTRERLLKRRCYKDPEFWLSRERTFSSMPLSLYS